MIKRPAHGPCGKDGGQTTVELALVMPLLILLVLGIIQFGLIIRAYVAVSHASREGARVAAVGFSNEEINEVILESMNTFEPERISVSVAPEDEESRLRGDDIAIRVSYELELIVPLVNRLISGPLSFESLTTTRIEDIRDG